jgi:hypothetical protein
LICAISALIPAISYGAYEDENIILSTKGKATLSGTRFRNGDLVKYDPVTQTSSLFFSESRFSRNTNIDTADILLNGNIVLSTTHTAKLGGLGFRNGDLIEYNPNTDKATQFFSESRFSRNENIDAADILPNGNIVLSTTRTAKLGGLRFRNGDLVEYNPNTDKATLFFSEGLFSHNTDIDAVDVLPDGSIVLSTKGPATLGGLRFRKNDLIRYFPYDSFAGDPLAGRATLYFSGGYFSSGSTDIDAASVVSGIPEVPEPATLLLLGLGAAILRKRQ